MATPPSYQTAPGQPWAAGNLAALAGIVGPDTRGLPLQRQGVPVSQGFSPNLSADFQGPPLGGLNLGALAASAGNETNVRIAGSAGFMDAYLSQVLGERNALGQSETERDLRLQDFARAQQLARQSHDEALEGQRFAAEASGDNVRIQANADEGRRSRDFDGNQGELGRAFELGQAAVARQAREDEMLLQNQMQMQQARFGQGLEDASFDRRLQMQQEALEPKLSDFGSESISAERGRALAQNQTLDGYRGQNPEQWQRDLASVRSIVEKHGSNPGKLMSELQKKYKKGGTDWVSLALWELGGGDALTG